MVWARLDLDQQSASALQPSAGHGGLVAELEVVRGQPGGYAGGGGQLTQFDIAPIGALTRREGQLRVVEEVATPAQSLQATWRLLLGQRRFEQRSRPGPVPLSKGAPTGAEWPYCWRCSHSA